MTQEASDAAQLLPVDVARKIDPGDGFRLKLSASWHGKQILTVQL